MLGWITTALSSLKNIRWIAPIFSFFGKFKKEITITSLAAVAAFAAGYWFASQNTEPKIVTKTDVVEKIVEKEVVVEKEVEKQQEKRDVKTTTTIEEKPDGTKTTKIVKEDKTETKTAKKTDTDTTTAKKSDKKEKNDETLQTVESDKYKLGVFTSLYPAEVIDNPDDINIDYGVSGSIKIADPIWLDSSYQIQSKEFTVGISWQF